jgi:hypothetical protein
MQSMNLTKLSAAIILALSTAACSSGGSHSTTSTSPVITEQTAAEKAEADRLAAEKAEADRLAAEKAEADRLAAEKAEADRLAAEKAAAIEANRLVLLNKAKEAGLNEQQATDYAEDNKEADEITAQKTLAAIIVNNEKNALSAEISAAKGIADNIYPIDSITAKTSTSSATTTNALTQESRIQSVVYNQPYSVVLGSYSGNISYNNQTGAIITDNRTSNIAIRGLKTTVDAIPTIGTATYIGKAFNGTYQNSFNWDTYQSSQIIKEGVLSYDVNFTNKTGSGSITGLGDVISLNQGSISGTGITSTAKQLTNTGTYSLDFYGKKAEEVAGKVIFNGKDTVGFGGTRGEITK